MRLIDADALTEELSTLTMVITGLRAGKGVLREFMTEYRESILRIVDEAPTVDAVILPCKLGETVYAIAYNHDACDDCDYYFPYEWGECDHTPSYSIFPRIDYEKSKVCPNHFLCVEEREMSLSYWESNMDNFGKTVFLTCEEAEAALAKMDRKDDT